MFHSTAKMVAMLLKELKTASLVVIFMMFFLEGSVLTHFSLTVQE